jgi:hypothetical protein
MLKKAFGEQAIGRTQTYEWFVKLKNGMTSVEDAQCSGCPVTARTDENVA